MMPVLNWRDDLLLVARLDEGKMKENTGIVTMQEYSESLCIVVVAAAVAGETDRAVHRLLMVVRLSPETFFEIGRHLFWAGLVDKFHPPRK